MKENDNIQLDIFQATIERDAGMQQAIDHANAVVEKWSDRAMVFLKKYIKLNNGGFMAEDVRMFAELMDFPSPPSARAWGSIMTRARREGLIVGIGYGKTKSKKAHRTPAGIWMKKD